MTNYRLQERNDFRFDHYHISTASCAYGDVIQVIDPISSLKKGIFLADTEGHSPIYGRDMKQFLDVVVKQGWGIEGNSEDEILRLSEIFLQRPRDYSVNCAYIQFYEDKISLVNAGLPFPIKVNETGLSEQLELYGLYLDKFALHHSPAYETSLKKDEILFLRTDGIDEGLINHLAKKEGHQRLVDTLQKNRLCSAVAVRDSLIYDLGKYFIPNSDKDDDASLIIIKRT